MVRYGAASKVPGTAALYHTLSLYCMSKTIIGASVSVSPVFLSETRNLIQRKIPTRPE